MTSDLALLQLIKNHDAAALETLYDRYEGMLVRFLFNRNVSILETEKIICEIYKEIWLSPDNYMSDCPLAAKLLKRAIYEVKISSNQYVSC